MGQKKTNHTDEKLSIKELGPDTNQLILAHCEQPMQQYKLWKFKMETVIDIIFFAYLYLCAGEDPSETACIYTLQK